MSRGESDQRQGNRSDRLTDWALGELSAGECRDLESQMAEDAVLAREAAEVRSLFSGLRDLETTASGRLELALCYAVDRRRRLRGSEKRFRLVESPVTGLLYCLRVAAVASVVLCGLLLGRSLLERAGYLEAEVPTIGHDELAIGPGSPGSAHPSHPSESSLPTVEPVASESKEEQPLFVERDHKFQSYYAPFAHLEQVSPFACWLGANNELSRLRQEFRGRFTAESRRRVIRATGGSSSLEDRIQDLAADIARKVDERIGREGEKGEAVADLEIQNVSLALRALLAAGSTPRLGPHQRSVRRCSRYLEERIATLEGGDLASAVSGLMDLAVVTGGPLARLVGVHADRLTRSVFIADETKRPSLLHWQTPAAQLADAGRVLQLAPAFGVESTRALRVRGYLAAHLEERIDGCSSERPDLLAAQLYGFGDLVDRRILDHKLLLWHAEKLVPDHYVALHHISWSQFPLRPGWARFQNELRMLSAQETPEALADAGALLLCLAMNYAAPGSVGLVALARH